MTVTADEIEQAVDALLDAAVDLEDHGVIRNGFLTDMGGNAPIIRSKSMQGAVNMARYGRANERLTWTDPVDALIMNALLAVTKPHRLWTGRTRGFSPFGQSGLTRWFEAVDDQEVIDALRAAAYLIRGDF